MESLFIFIIHTGFISYIYQILIMFMGVYIVASGIKKRHYISIIIGILLVVGPIYQTFKGIGISSAWILSFFSGIFLGFIGAIRKEKQLILMGVFFISIPIIIFIRYVFFLPG